ncbi:MAG: outer membrane lipoprotein carrier protein LolA [Tateyamaria sp.]|uniref:LolA family protein n=1 Tax=Tateyamaria sp. TaxID=1929288 RepID=UPI003292F290
MIRITRIAAFAVALLAGQSALADKLPLNTISAYLNDLKTAEGSFTQINDDGSISTGKLYIKRPGRMRFEYNAPDTALVVASANAVYIVDSKSNQPPETYPLRRTPLSLILARNVNLSAANMVVGHDFDGTATVVTAQDPKNPEYGSIQMKFTGNPVQLRQWVVNDNGGGKTTVVLGELKTGGSLSNRLFSEPRSDRN